MNRLKNIRSDRSGISKLSVWRFFSPHNRNQIARYRIPSTLNRTPIIFLIFLLCVIHVFPDDFFQVKDRVIGESSLKLGFLYLTPLFFLQNVGYTSNVFNYEEYDTPDWTGDIGLGLRASAIVANRLILQAEDLPYYSFYLNSKELRTWSNGFKASAYSYVGLFNFKAGFARNDLTQRPNLEFGRPYHYADREWSAELDFGRRQSLFVTAYAKFKNHEYDEDPYWDGYDLADSLNHRQKVLGIRLHRRVFTRTLIYANYEWSDYLFTFRSERDARAHQLALGVIFPEIGLLQGSFQIGLKRFEPANPLFQAAQRPTGRGDIHATLFKRLRLSFFYELQTYFSYGAPELFYDNQMFGGGAELYLTRSLKFGATYHAGYLRFRSLLDLALIRSDRLIQQQYVLAVPFLHDMSLGISYNIYRLTSEALSFDIIRKYWGGFISYEF